MINITQSVSQYPSRILNKVCPLCRQCVFDPYSTCALWNQSHTACKLHDLLKLTFMCLHPVLHGKNNWTRLVLEKVATWGRFDCINHISWSRCISVRPILPWPEWGISHFEFHITTKPVLSMRSRDASKCILWRVACLAQVNYNEKYPQDKVHVVA